LLLTALILALPRAARPAARASARADASARLSSLQFHEADAHGAASWGGAGWSVGTCVTAGAFLSAVYRERRRQRTQLSIWRRLQIGPRG